MCWRVMEAVPATAPHRNPEKTLPTLGASTRVVKQRGWSRKADRLGTHRWVSDRSRATRPEPLPRRHRLWIRTAESRARWRLDASLGRTKIRKITPTTSGRYGV